MTELETRLRDALYARADEITPSTLRRPVRDGRAPRRRGQWLLAAAVVLLVLAIAAPVALLRGSGGGSSQRATGSAAYFGWKWTVTVIADRQGRLDVPARLGAAIDFPAGGGHVGGDDSVNYSYGVLQLSGDGYDVSQVGTTAAGYGGNDPVVLRTIAGVDALFVSSDPRGVVHVRATLVSDTLTLSAGDVTVTTTRGEPDATPAPSDSNTGSGSSGSSPLSESGAPISGSMSPGYSGPATSTP